MTTRMPARSLLPLLAAYDLYVTSLTQPDARELSWIFASSTSRDARAHRDAVRALVRAPHMEAARRVILPTATPDHLAHSTRLTGASLDEDARDCASFANARYALRQAHPGRKHCGLVWMTRHKVVSCDPRTRVVRLPLNLGVGRSDHAAWVIFVNQEAPRLTRDLGEALEAACSAAPPGREVQVYPIPEAIVGDFERDMPAAIQKHLGLLAV